jgi:phosphoglycerate dehydrogenase-like enzyme
LKVAVLDDWARVASEYADWDKLDAEVIFFNEALGDKASTDLQEFEVICLMRERTPFPAILIDQLPNLRLIVTTGPRNLSIDVEAARRNRVVVSGTRSRKTTTSELSLALMLSLSRRLIPEARALDAGGWQGAPGKDLAGARLGLVGLGSIGQQMAVFGRILGMDVFAWSPNLTTERAQEVGVQFAPTLVDLAGQSDVLSVHMVLAETTQGLISAPALKAMPGGSILINTSRAGLLDRDALFDAMRTGGIQSAGIDVYEEEPIPPGNPWLKAKAEFGDRLLLTPHLGYVTEKTWRMFYEDTVEAIEAYVAGEPIRTL